MTKREIAALSCRILALYTAIGAFSSLTQFFTIATGFGGITRPDVNGALLSLLPGAIHLLVAGALWFFADSLGASMAGAPDQQNAHVATHDFRSVAFSVLGAFFLVGATANLAATAIQVILPISFGSSQFFPAELMRNLVTFALGLWLLLGARGVTRWIASLRNLGRDSSM